MSQFPTLQEALNILSNVLIGIKNQSDMKNLLDDLLTPQELTEMAERINIIRLLKQGKTQREIAVELGISVTTVNRGARMLKYGTGWFRNSL